MLPNAESMYYEAVSGLTRRCCLNMLRRPSRNYCIGDFDIIFFEISRFMGPDWRQIDFHFGADS